MKTLFIFIGLLVCFKQSSGQECGDGYFQCDNGECINELWVCDGDLDCSDGSDEPPDCPPCPVYQFECANGNCVSITWICDGDDDCGDLSDEVNPETGVCPLCPESHFQCLNGRCVARSAVCNGVNNCQDNSDEFDDPDQCPPCSDGQFRCNNGRCINGAYVCDGDFDCTDFSDETEDACPCSDDEIRCSVPPGQDPQRPGACIPPEWICDEDGIWDCPNGDDEENCAVRARKPHPKNSHSSLYMASKKISQRKLKQGLERKEKNKIENLQSRKKSQLWKRIFMKPVHKK